MKFNARIYTFTQCIYLSLDIEKKLSNNLAIVCAGVVQW